MKMSIRVVLVDDHPITRAGIKRFLDRAVDVEVVGEASTGEQALELVEQLSPDVLLLDMELPDLKGVTVAKRLKESGSPVHILALSTYNNKQYIFGLLSIGAAGYLTKEEVPETILEAVRGVARGEQGWVSRKVAAVMSTWAQADASQPSDLTDREMQVLRGVVDGKTNQEIGLDLGISQKTVEKHLESVYSKMNVASRVEAAVMAVRQGMF
jgi:DNA-binding NarL/FixJ family response regulator